MGGLGGGSGPEGFPHSCSARFVLALPASSTVLSHVFDLPVCVSVRRSSRPGCGGVGGLHQSQRLRHGQLVSPSPSPHTPRLSAPCCLVSLACLLTCRPRFKSFQLIKNVQRDTQNKSGCACCPQLFNFWNTSCTQCSMSRTDEALWLL